MTFLKYIKDFCLEMNLLNENSRVVVAVSGGVDSMVLLDVMSEFLKLHLISSLRAIHINHGTRPENKREEDMVRIFCNLKNVELKIVKLNLPFQANFESIAHQKRCAEFNNFLNDGEVLATAHHVDDAFEWSLLCALKASTVRPTLGIAVKNGRVIRPFMSASKNQLYYYARSFKVPFMEDKSNENIDYERNFIRNIIKTKIRPKFPRYLYHFVEQKNVLAHKLNLSAKRNCLKIETYKDKFLGVTVLMKDRSFDFSGVKDDLTKIICSLSDAERGVIRSQLNKGLKASQNGNVGPLIFSGNVLGFFYPGFCYFINRKNLKKIEDFDEKFSKNIDDLKTPAVDITALIKLLFSGDLTVDKLFIFSELDVVKKHYPGLKKIDPLFKKTSASLIERGFYFRTLLQTVKKFENSSDVCKFKTLAAKDI